MRAALSPLTAANIAAVAERPALDTSAADWHSRYRRYVCPSCEGTHSRKSSAETCCTPEVTEVYVHPVSGEHFDTAAELAAAAQQDSASVCPVCSTSCADAHGAANCCLWKDLPPETRYRIAFDVERGMDWQDAIERHAPKEKRQ